MPRPKTAADLRKLAIFQENFSIVKGKERIELSEG